jgi:hypothetical protein
VPQSLADRQGEAVPLLSLAEVLPLLRHPAELVVGDRCHRSHWTLGVCRQEVQNSQIGRFSLRQLVRLNGLDG